MRNEVTPMLTDIVSCVVNQGPSNLTAAGEHGRDVIAGTLTSRWRAWRKRITVWLVAEKGDEKRRER